MEEEDKALHEVDEAKVPLPAVWLTLDMIQCKEIEREIGKTSEGNPIKIIIRDMDLSEFSGLWKKFNRKRLVKGVNLLTQNTEGALELMRGTVTPETFDDELIHESLDALADIAEMVLVRPKLTKQQIIGARGMLGLNIVLEVFNVCFSSLRAEDTLKKISSMIQR